MGKKNRKKSKQQRNVQKQEEEQGKALSAKKGKKEINDENDEKNVFIKDDNNLNEKKKKFETKDGCGENDKESDDEKILPADADAAADVAASVAPPTVAKLPDADADESSSNDDESSSSSDDDDEDEDLMLEGVIVRNPDVSDSDDTTDDDDDDSSNDDDDEEEEEEDSKPPPKKKTKSSSSSTATDITKKTKQQNQSQQKMDNNKMQQIQQQKKTQKTKKKKKKKKDSSEPEMIQVEFTFCDMNEKYFHGLKSLLISSSPLYGNIIQSSSLADLMIENISVGTVISSEGDVDGTIYGFASVLNVTTYQHHTCIQTLKKLCLDQCPSQHRGELQTVLSGTTKRPAGFYLHGRMINLPLEIVEILHQQLVLDMDWAVQHAQVVPDNSSSTVSIVDARKALDFGAFVRIAPSYKAGGGSGSGGTSSSSSSNYYYKYFDDEIFAGQAEFTYPITLPKGYTSEEIPYCMVIVMTKTGHRQAMKDLSTMVNGTGR